MGERFSSFRKTFVPVSGEHQQVDGQPLAANIERLFGMRVPKILADFWDEVGTGYFADRELYLFGQGHFLGREGLVEWNSKEIWRTVYAPPSQGGPLFFAETCFGMQLGLLWEADEVTGYLLDLDTLAAYRVAKSCEELLQNVLSERFVFSDPELLAVMRTHLGLQPNGMHYAPIVSPLFGGTLSPENHHLEPANVHLQTSIASWQVIQQARQPSRE